MDLGKASEDFKTASDELRKAVSLSEIAAECGVSVESLRRAMLEEGSDAYEPPPRFWKGDLAYLARERAEALLELADELEGSAWAPASEEELEEIGSMILNEFHQKVIQPAEEFEAKQKRWAKGSEAREQRRAEREQRRADEFAEVDEVFNKGGEEQT